MRKLLAATLLAGASYLTGVQAQDLDAARACTNLRDAAVRLTCYDAAFGVAAQFGGNGQFRNTTQTDMPKNLTLAAQQVTALPEGHYQLMLDNGQVWQTTQADWMINFKAGDLVTISRMPLGGYQISSPGSGHSSVGAKRIR